MKLFSYIVARDYGFAPNPFFGYCTLATCMPTVRRRAAIGDWVVGTGAKLKYNLSGHLIFAMKVDEVMDFNRYWKDSRFRCKRPSMNGSLKQLYGDNIYHSVGVAWVQANSHHSLASGQPNLSNVDHDTSVDRVLIGQKFVYYGASAPAIPGQFRPYEPERKDICCLGRGYRSGSHDFAAAFESWIAARGEYGVLGMPLEFH